MASEPVRILIADDHQIVVDLLASAFQSESQYEVVGKASNGSDAIRLAVATEPDVILVDIDMPEIDGIRATRAIVQKVPGSKVIGLSVHREWKVISEIFDAGASGYLTKESAYSELISAVECVLGGKVYISPSISAVVLNARLSPAKESRLEVLTPREKDVFTRLADGKSAKEIAFELGLSATTVHAHRRQILNKLHLNGIADLVKLALELGTVQPRKS